MPAGCLKNKHYAINKISDFPRVKWKYHIKTFCCLCYDSKEQKKLTKGEKINDKKIDNG